MSNIKDLSDCCIQLLNCIRYLENNHEEELKAPLELIDKASFMIADVIRKDREIKLGNITSNNYFDNSYITKNEDEEVYHISKTSLIESVVDEVVRYRVVMNSELYNLDDLDEEEKENHIYTVKCIDDTGEFYTDLWFNKKNDKVRRGFKFKR